MNEKLVVEEKSFSADLILLQGRRKTNLSVPVYRCQCIVSKVIDTKHKDVREIRECQPTVVKEIVIFLSESIVPGVISRNQVIKFLYYGEHVLEYVSDEIVGSWIYIVEGPKVVGIARLNGFC